MKKLFVSPSQQTSPEQTWHLSGASQRQACSFLFFIWATLFFFFPSHGPLFSSFLHSLSSQAFLWYLYFPPELSTARTDLEFSSAASPAPFTLLSHWLTSSHVIWNRGGADIWLSSQILELQGLTSHTCGVVGRQTHSCVTVSGVCFFRGGGDGRLFDHVQEAAAHREQWMPGQHDPRDAGYLPEDGSSQTPIRVQAGQDHCPSATT